MKKILGRILIVIPAIALQAGWYFIMFGLIENLLNAHLGYALNIFFSILAVFFVLGLVSKRDESSYKLLWVMIIIAMPILGAMLYFLLGNKNTSKKLKRRLNQSASELKNVFKKDDNIVILDSNGEDLRIIQTLNHVSESSRLPITKNETSKYYPFGEDMFKDMCDDLNKAKSYIFVEYFIIQEGKFWNTLKEIMTRKASEGVDVRVIYDDLGCIGTYSVSDIIDLSKKGIKCVPFNPFLFVKSQLNNRDHRKIMIIDGNIAYSGGVNLADEYINAVNKYGVWKDIGFRITGDAVKSYLYMFIEFWNAFSNSKISKNLICLSSKTDVANGNGYILSYYDSPMNEEHISNVFFTEVLSIAARYVWFYTPYLILGDALFDAFTRAAKRGVDVRIIMPGIPDKKIIYRLSRSYYKDLLDAGVKIYEYTPGFVHAKAFISDDKIAGIGTVNLDYRSLFLHFECNSIFYKADIIKQLKQDFLNTQSESIEKTQCDINRNPFYRIIDNFLRVLAPLL